MMTTKSDGREGSISVPVDEKNHVVQIRIDGQPLLLMNEQQAHQLSMMLFDAAVVCGKTKPDPSQQKQVARNR